MFPAGGDTEFLSEPNCGKYRRNTQRYQANWLF